jgi:hypothetical protein
LRHQGLLNRIKIGSDVFGKHQFDLRVVGRGRAVYRLAHEGALLDSRCTVLPRRDAIKSLQLSASQSQRLASLRLILEEDQSRLRYLLNASHIDVRALILSGFLVLPVLAYTKLRPLHTLEPVSHEYVLSGLAVFVFVALIIAVLHVRGLWMELRRLLIALDSVPLRRAFQQLTGFTWSPLWQLGGGNLGDFRRLISHQSEALRCLFSLRAPLVSNIQESFMAQAYKTLTAFDRVADHCKPKQKQERAADKQDKRKSDRLIPLAAVLSQDSESLPFTMSYATATTTREVAGMATSAQVARISEPRNAPKVLSRLQRFLLPERVQKEISLVEEFHKLQQQFAIAGLHTLALAVSEWDGAATIAESPANQTRSSSKENSDQRTKSYPKGPAAANPIQDGAERFLALLYTNFIAVVLGRIRSLIIAVGGMYVLFVLALTTYPFQPESQIRFFLAMSLLFIVSVVGIVYAQMHRDETLSHVTNTSPGQLGSSFWLRIASFIALPVFSLVASGYPEIGNVLYSWLEPALHALQ